MDFDPTNLFVSLMVSTLGLAFFIYGKKQTRAPQMAVGAFLMVFPYFVSGAALMLLVTAVAVGLCWLAVRAGW